MVISAFAKPSGSSRPSTSNGNIAYGSLLGVSPVARVGPKKPIFTNAAKFKGVQTQIDGFQGSKADRVELADVIRAIGRVESATVGPPLLIHSLTSSVRLSSLVHQGLYYANQ